MKKEGETHGWQGRTTDEEKKEEERREIPRMTEQDHG
jgi:hypothetical protein